MPLFLETNLLVRGTRETEPRMRDGYHFTPNTEQRYKTYDIPTLRRIKEIRAEAAKEGNLLPPNPCPYKICACCDPYRAFWKEALKTQLSLF